MTFLSNIIYQKKNNLDRIHLAKYINQWKTETITSVYLKLKLMLLKMATKNKWLIINSY